MIQKHETSIMNASTIKPSILKPQAQGQYVIALF
jgi:hypothetical protein